MGWSAARGERGGWSSFTPEVALARGTRLIARAGGPRLDAEPFEYLKRGSAQVPAAVIPSADDLLRHDVVHKPRTWLIEEADFPLRSSSVLDDFDTLHGSPGAMRSRMAYWRDGVISLRCIANHYIEYVSQGHVRQSKRAVRDDSSWNATRASPQRGNSQAELRICSSAARNQPMEAIELASRQE